MTDFPASIKAALAPVRAAFRQSHGDQLDAIEEAVSGVIRDWGKLDEPQRTQCIEYAKMLMKSLGAGVELAAKRALNEALRTYGGAAAKAVLGAL